MRLTHCLLLCLVVASPLSGEVKIVKQTTPPNRIAPQILVIGADWLQRTPPTGQVNAPEYLTSLYPGQKIALALSAQGPERDKLFDGLKVGVQFLVDKKPAGKLPDVKISAVRHIKAEGADFSLMALEAGGIAPKDLRQLESATSLVSFAILLPKWTVPDTPHEQDVEIIVTLSGTATPTQIEPLTLKVRPASTWLHGPSMNAEDINNSMRSYHACVPPGRLLAILTVVAHAGDLRVPAVASYFAAMYKEHADARRAAVTLFPKLDQKTQEALLISFRLAGQDIDRLFPSLPANERASFRKIEPLQDPRLRLPVRNPVKPEDIRAAGAFMDECWGCWMATGDVSYLRTLVNLLEGAPDFAAFQKWKDTRGGVKGLNVQVARGLTYQIAGWSISSFQRTDPLVSDWLGYWKKDPAFPASLKSQLTTLFTNPAFRQDTPNSR